MNPIIEKIEDTTKELLLGNDIIGYVNAIEMCNDLNINLAEDDITEQTILFYMQLCGGGNLVT